MTGAFSVPDHILYEDDAILVMDKPSGLMVEPDRNGHPNLLQHVRNYLKSVAVVGDEVYAQHIHRLDRPVRGVILFAKKRSVLKNLSEQFAERRVRKSYQALTEQAPATRKGTLVHWLRKEKKKGVIYDHEIEYSEKVILDYIIAETEGKRFLWDIELHTGKYHQIRAQLSYIGCAILGDEAYGSAVSWHPNTIALRATRLVFVHPLTNAEINVECPDF